MEILSSEFVTKDSRRELQQLLTADIKQINNYHAERGAILGDHYHRSTTEYFYVTRGTFMVQVSSNSFAANPGFFFRVDPGEKHTLEALTDKASFLTFLSEPYDNDRPDIYK